jgi:hypothetical protein
MEGARGSSKALGEKEFRVVSPAEPEQGSSEMVTRGLRESNDTATKRRVRNRLPPLLSLLYSRRLLAALFGAMVQASITTAFDPVLTIHVANTFHWTLTGAALLLLPIVIPCFLGPVFGWLSDRYGGHYLATVEFLRTCPLLVHLPALRRRQHNQRQSAHLRTALRDWTEPHDDVPAVHGGNFGGGGKQKRRRWLRMACVGTDQVVPMRKLMPCSTWHLQRGAPWGHFSLVSWWNRRVGQQWRG